MEWFGGKNLNGIPWLSWQIFEFFLLGMDQKILRFFQAVKAMRFMKIMKITKIMKVYEKYIINGIFTQVTNSYIILPSEQFLTKKILGVCSLKN